MKRLIFMTIGVVLGVLLHGRVPDIYLFCAGTIMIMAVVIYGRYFAR